MASRSDSQMKSDDFRHFCSLCMESYSGRTPKLLPCFHTFCLPCLTMLAEKHSACEGRQIKDGEEKEASSEDETQATVKESPDEGEEEEEDQFDQQRSGRNLGVSGESERSDATGELKHSSRKLKKTFPCPACRSPVAIPSAGLSALQTNFYLTVDVDSNAEPADKGPHLCDMCEEGGQEEAQHFCHSCQQHMCQACRRLHDRVTGARDHRVEALSDPSTPQLEASVRGKKMCQFHPDQILCFHCCQCDVTICLHCKLTSHEGHDTQDMATAAVQAKGELSGLHARANQQLQLLEACISRLERDELDLKRQKDEVVQQVASRFELLIGWATRARDELLEEMAAKEQASLRQIHMKKASASFFKGNISSKKMRASQSMGLGANVVLVKNELQAALLKDESLEEHQALASRKSHLTFFTTTLDASALDLGVVRAYMGELIDSPAEGTDGASLSLHEMALAITRMEADLQQIKEKSPVSKVAFHVRMASNYNFSSNQKVIFDNVLCNEGGVYDSSTGIFTSTAEGTYMFTTTLRNSSNGYNCSVALMVKGVEWGRIESPDSSTAHCVVSLKKGDQVWVQSYGNYQFLTACCMFTGAVLST